MAHVASRIVLGVLILAIAAPVWAKDKKKESDPTADGMTEYKDAKHNFKMKYPSSWQKTIGTKDPVVTFADNVNGRVADEIAVSRERAAGIKRDEKDLDLVMAEVEVQLRKRFPAFQVVQEKSVEFGGFPGRSVLFTGRNDKGIAVEVSTTFTLAGGEFYMMTCATTPDRYSAMSQTFNESIASFEITVKKK